MRTNDEWARFTCGPEETCGWWAAWPRDLICPLGWLLPRIFLEVPGLLQTWAPPPELPAQALNDWKARESSVAAGVAWFVVSSDCAGAFDGVWLLEESVFAGVELGGGRTGWLLRLHAGRIAARSRVGPGGRGPCRQGTAEGGGRRGVRASVRTGSQCLVGNAGDQDLRLRIGNEAGGLGDIEATDGEIGDGVADRVGAFLEPGVDLVDRRELAEA